MRWTGREARGRAPVPSKNGERNEEGSEPRRKRHRTAGFRTVHSISEPATLLFPLPTWARRHMHRHPPYTKENMSASSHAYRSVTPRGSRPRQHVQYQAKAWTRMIRHPGRRPSTSQKNVWREVAVGVGRNSTEYAQQQLAEPLTEQTKQLAHVPADDARDCGAAEDTAGALVDLRFITGAKSKLSQAPLRVRFGLKADMCNVALCQ